MLCDVILVVLRMTLSHTPIESIVAIHGINVLEWKRIITTT